MLSSTTVKDGPLYTNVIKQDIVKCDIVLKGCLQNIREHDGEESELNALAALVRSKTNQMRSLLATLRTLAQEQRRGEGHDAALQEVSELEAALHRTHTSLRTALARAQLALTEREKSELLLYSSDTGRPAVEGGARPRMGKELALKQSSQLTDDLLTVTRMIQDNTDKSAKTLDKLVESSDTIGGTREELKTMGSVINQAHKVLSKYGRRENTDKLLIFLGVVFFAACCLVVIRNRLNLF